MSWEEQALCREVDPDLFFFAENERGPSRRNRAAAAKAICEACSVVKQCLEFALRYGMAYGIWGGMTEEERQVWK